MNDTIVEGLTQTLVHEKENECNVKITKEFIEIGIVIATFSAVQSFPI